MKNSLFKNSMFKALLSICNIIIPLIIGPYVTHLLNVDLYGSFNRVISELNVFIVIGSFGVYNYGIKEISKIRNDKAKVNDMFTNLFVISLITNLIVCIIYLFYAFFTSSGIVLIIYLTSSVQFLANIFYMEFVNEALENYKFITEKTLIVRIIYLLCIFLFVKNENDIILYSIIYSGVVFVNNIISYLYIKKHIKFNFKNLNLKRYLKPLLMIFLIGSVEILYFQLDKVMLGKLVSDVSVSIYQIPYMIMSMIITIPTAVVSVSIPRLSNILAEKGKKEYEDKLSSVFSYFMILILPVCFGVFALSDEIIYLYAGQKYLESAALLKVFSITRIFIGFEAFMTLLIIYINNKEKNLLQIFSLVGFLNLIVNIVLFKINLFNPLNAALSTGILYVLLVCLEFWYIRKKVNVDVKIFKKNNSLYLLLSLSFVLVSYFTHYIFDNMYIVILSTMCLCILIYVFGLLISKDQITLNTINNFLLKFKRRKL